MDTSQSAFLETMRRQFDFGPYPREPIDHSPSNEPNELFIYNLATPYYLRYQKVAHPEGKLILDAGCGTGYKALVLAIANPGAKIVGVDISPKSVELAQQRLEHHGFKDSVEFHLLAIEDLPQLGMAFDYINCDEVLYFFDDIARGLADLKSVLKPEGIIRTNLHSALQRALYFRAQELFGLMGLMDPDAQEMAIPIVVETMQALKTGVNLKKLGWESKYEADDNAEILLANHLMQQDKGYRIADLFLALEQAELAFLSMTNWRQWEVADLFNEPNNLPAYVAMGLADSTPQDRLTIYELLNPVHRLLDFWCVHPAASPDPAPLAEWDLATWQTAQVTLHPQLCTDKVKAAAITAIQTRNPLLLSNFLNITALETIAPDSSVASMLLRLFDGPKSFNQLVDHWRTIRSVDWVTMAPIAPETAQQQVMQILTKLEVFLYVLVEPQP
jgi:SAM-dependent methyltransferase